MRTRYSSPTALLGLPPEETEKVILVELRNPVWQSYGPGFATLPSTDGACCENSRKIMKRTPFIRGCSARYDLSVVAAIVCLPCPHGHVSDGAASAEHKSQ